MTRIPGVRALGVDPGTKRIGLAVSDRSGTLASPLRVLHRSRSAEHDLREIVRIARDEEAQVIVVGLPLNMDGSHGPAARAATTVASRLATLTDVPIEMHDERRSTVTADRNLAEAGHDGVRRRQVIDMAAAAVMLQSWLDARAAPARSEA
ncbi:MAG: Holliday junction resolvase RuvX [Ilumatobacteraceae bacterium]